MIWVTRMSGEALCINATMIELVEHTPDTVITLYSGRKYVVRENAQEVAELTMNFYKMIGIVGSHGGKVLHRDES